MSALAWLSTLIEGRPSAHVLRYRVMSLYIMTLETLEVWRKCRPHHQRHSSLKQPFLNDVIAKAGALLKLMLFIQRQVGLMMLFKYCEFVMVPFTKCRTVRTLLEHQMQPFTLRGHHCAQCTKCDICHSDPSQLTFAN